MYGASPVDSSESAKKSLQAAKDHYLAEKERYRRIREERKKRKMNVSTDRYVCMMRGFSRRSVRADRRFSEMRDVQDSPTTPNDVPEPPVRPAGETSPIQRRNTVDDQAQIISNARGPFPQLQLYPVPRRSHTIHGAGHARDASFGSNAPPPAIPRAVSAITTRLNDVRAPFSPRTFYPMLMRHPHADGFHRFAVSGIGRQGRGTRGPVGGGEPGPRGHHRR